MYPRAIEKLIQGFAKFPGVGERAAERYVFHLLKSGKKDVAELAYTLKQLFETIKSCEICWNFADTSPCAICTDKKRDSTLLCVVENSQSLEAIERLGTYTGKYHVLRGVMKVEDEKSLTKLKIQELLLRIQKENTKEVILSLNPDIHGETTMMYLERRIKKEYPDTKISRLARGLPMGGDLQYADEITLQNALKNRQ